MARRLSRTGASRSTRCLALGPDDELVHVDVGRVQQAAALGRGEHRDGVGLAGGAEVGALERIDGDVDFVELARRPPLAFCAMPDFLADVEHRRLVALAFADDDGAVDRDRVELLAHRLTAA